MKRKIRDTDIVYSAVSRRPDVLRFSLSPCLDDCQWSDGPEFPARAAYINTSYSSRAVSDEDPVRESCRSPGAWSQRCWDSDRWLDYLAGGEPMGE